MVGVGVALAFGLSACGDDGGGSGRTVPETIDGVPAAYADIACDNLSRCSAQAIIDLFVGADCEAQLAAEIEDSQLTAWKAAIAAGTLVYDRSKLGACLDALVAQGCELFTSRMPDACEEALAGQVAADGDCNVSVECAGPTYCRVEDACPGSCAARTGAGTPCDHDEACQDGLSCQRGSCAAVAGDGEPCEGDGAGECRLGLLCVGEDDDTGTPGTCKQFEAIFTEALGEECDVDTGALCQEGLSCAVESIGIGGATLRCVEPSASGAPCSFGIPSPCPDGEYCDANISSSGADGDCVPLPGMGEPCADQPFGLSCEEGLTCIDGTCGQQRRLGAPCADDRECVSNRCAGGACEAPLCE